MNAFPDDYIVHNLPLIILSGLGDEIVDKNAGEKARGPLNEGGFRIRADLPAVKGADAQALLSAILSHDATNKPWHVRGLSQAEQNAVFRIHCTGRTYTLPARKAPPPAHSPRLRPATDGSSPPPQLTLHSTISPLTPSSPLYPDGIMTSIWITKHQSRLPSAFLSFFTLVSDNDASTLLDNKLKYEISNMRSVLSSTNYKTRLVIVLMGDGDIRTNEAEERLNNIRKAANLDAKSLFYFPAASSKTDIADFVQSMLDNLYAGCIEYYRELSKHARRKRNRNIVPQPTIQPHSGTSKTLSLAGWNVRYEFKLAVFAEFRQEMEAALRNYETAYEGIFGPEVFETIPSWSPRFNETRSLADITAIRIIRCLLWLGQTTNAVKSWASHRNRIRSLIDRRGVGTESYAWEAWQNVWSRSMAELIQRSQILAVTGKQASETSPWPIFISSEKTLPADQRYAPWESLHHEGYWLNLAQQHVRNRRTRAFQMPEEDRVAPGQSPASKIASKAHLYDKYLVMEPHRELPSDGSKGYDYSSEVIEALDRAVRYFSDHDQARMAEILQLKKALELIDARLWNDAISVLHSVWESQAWRKAGWWVLLEQVAKGLLLCASEVANEELVTQIQWQSQNPVFTSRIFEDSNDQQASSGVEAALNADNSLTAFIPAFVFAAAEGHAGESMDVQISIQRTGLYTASTFRMSQVKVVFEGALKPIYLLDDPERVSDTGSESVTITEVELQDGQSSASKARRTSLGAVAIMSVDASLALKPGQVKVFQTQILPHEAGDVSVASISMIFENNGHEVTVTSSGLRDTSNQWWEVQRGKPVSRLCGRQREVSSAKILPKPPKIELRFQEMRKAFYTNESIDLVIQAENHEDQTVWGTIGARLLSPGKSNTVLKWTEEDVLAIPVTNDAVTFVQQLSTKDIGEIVVGGILSHSISINNTDEAIDHELEIRVDYALQPSPDIRLSKTLTIDIPIIRPFEANFSFHSRLHEETWPNFFSAQTVSAASSGAVGIKQQYYVSAMACSFAIEDIVIESANLTAQKIVGDAQCTITPVLLQLVDETQQSEEASSVLVHPEETKRFGFNMTVQKLVLGDRQPVAIDFILEVQWQRKGTGRLNTSVLQVPRFLAPTSEPRVLLQSMKDENMIGLYQLNYTIENPSLHFLTFNISMESSDEFAFSGTKSKSLSLVPVSRHNVMYRILSEKSKTWIKVHLEVVDAYFGQTLRIQPASDGVRVDKQGNVLVWIE